MALFILPLRLGEFARPYLVAERPALRVSAALSSVVVERVADGIFTAALLVVALLAVPEGTPNLALLRGAGWVMLGSSRPCWSSWPWPTAAARWRWR